jgi:hypothetical protein
MRYNWLGLAFWLTSLILLSALTSRLMDSLLTALGR